MTKEEFCQEVASVEAYVLAVSNLLAALNEDHFSWNEKGALSQYESFFPEDTGKQAKAWISDNYESISSIVRGAMYLAEATYNMVEPLWGEAQRLISDDEKGGSGTR
ncbi:MAG: hypothetical protein VB096_05910 [Pseudoflavonifractor sp.]|nr:hypothetical protein [Pseudoflavonifractor sp.]